MPDDGKLKSGVSSEHAVNVLSRRITGNIGAICQHSSICLLRSRFHAEETRGDVTVEGADSNYGSSDGQSGQFGPRECMESLGGGGYIDSILSLEVETNIARVYRDANALSIWGGKGGAEVLRPSENWVGAGAER
ncbi:hypothetical protein HO133_004657 [Letharia lupina]|uniref:Uncharacterized protein n=1 Tax=Letharia lupina TaxID=560253 RepID=A0A8H6FKQ1_9LECA|nr:uncharacterized protein HO133_004657 [Letharia lupina]KAF6230317.1 hypothetical protein HO133_004657 [Letharia lupina]